MKRKLKTKSIIVDPTLMKRKENSRHSATASKKTPKTKYLPMDVNLVVSPLSAPCNSEVYSKSDGDGLKLA